MNPKETLLAALEEVERHEDDIEGEIKLLCVAFAVENADKEFRVGWVYSDSPYYAAVGLLGEVQGCISEAAGEWVGDGESDDEED